MKSGVRRSFFARSFKRSGWTSKGRTQEKGSGTPTISLKKKTPHGDRDLIFEPDPVWEPLLRVLGYRIGGERQGEGFGTEAAKEGTRIGFEELSLHRMEADVMTENRASLRDSGEMRIQKEGYSGIFQDQCKWEDHIHMAAIRA